MPVFDPTANFSTSLVAVVPSPAISGLSLTVATGEGALFPTPGTVGFNAVVWTGSQPLASNSEIVRVTGIAGDVLTIVRGQEGTSPRAITLGDKISANITKRMLDNLQQAAASRAYAFFST